MHVAFYLSGNPVHDNVILAMHAGCPENRRVIQGFKFQPDADIAVVFGVHKSRVPISWPRGKIIEQQKMAGGRVLVLETGYINRGDGDKNHYAAGFDGLNGRADFRNKGMPSDRAESLGVSLKPRVSGRNIVLCGQVPQDASVDHIDIHEWLIDAREKIKNRTERHIVFRPHPLAKGNRLDGCGFSQRSLAEDLREAHCCVTFNSNSAVEAVIEGVPAFAFDVGSMALSVANTDWDKIESPELPDRKQWLNDLAYTQWTPEEMRKGVAWNHLFR